jgi:hypothetical protein
MGRQVEQAALFYEFSLERHVPSDHLLRSIDRFVDLGGCAASALRDNAFRLHEMGVLPDLRPIDVRVFAARLQRKHGGRRWPHKVGHRRQQPAGIPASSRCAVAAPQAG